MKKFLKLKQDNRGSGIVTVLICILFLTVLGTMVLMAAYTGYRMKISEVKGRQNVYNAEVALGEIRTGFQDVCSDAVGGALTDYLVTTGSYEEFVQSYVDIVKSWTVRDFEGNRITYTGVDNTVMELKLFKSTTATGGKYNPEALAAMIRNCREGTIYINTYSPELEAGETPSNFNDRVIIRKGPQYGIPNVVVKTDPDNPENDRITFENMSVTFKTDGGTAENTITTDMEIKIPTDNLPSGESGMRVDQIQEYSLISASSLKQTTLNAETASTIGGNSYFNAIETAMDNMLVFWGETGKTIVKNDVTVNGNATEDGRRRIEFANGSNLYARNIFVERSSLAALEGSSLNVANDLTLNGKAKVYVESSYVGFGTDTVDEDGNPVPDSSSAILYNGSDCSVYFNSVNSQLVLGGLSFISGDSVSNFMTGETIMVKPTQLAYLVEDAECIVPQSYEDGDETKQSKTIKHNPIAVSSVEGYENYSLDTSKVILRFKNDEGADETRSYSDYSASVRKFVQARGSQYMIYFFLDFNPTTDDDGNVLVSAEENAKKYYSDYYYAHRDRLDETISSYKAVYRNLGAELYSGNGLEEANGKTKPKVNGPFINLKSQLETIRKNFYNFVSYLSDVRPADYLNPMDSTNAYSSFTYDELYGTGYSRMTMAQYCSTYELSEEDPETGDMVLKDKYDNPFYYMVDLQNLYRIEKNSKKFYKYNGENIAVVCRGNFTYPDDFSDNDRNLKLILCEGNITINNSGNEAGKPAFAGTMIVSGDIILDDVVDITSSRETFLNAYNSIGDSEKDVFTQYFRVALMESFDFGDAGLDDGDYSIVFQLVNYVNWKKD